MSFQLIHCEVAIAGDIRNVVYRGVDNPVTYPELLVLEFIHGQGSVANVVDGGETDTDPAEERARLRRIYGGEVINQLFPGVAGPLPARNDELPKAEEMEALRLAQAAAKEKRKRNKAATNPAPKPTVQPPAPGKVDLPEGAGDQLPET